MRGGLPPHAASLGVASLARARCVRPRAPIIDIVRCPVAVVFEGRQSSQKLTTAVRGEEDGDLGGTWQRRRQGDR
jgi:hypothetical protein